MNIERNYTELYTKNVLIKIIFELGIQNFTVLLQKSSSLKSLDDFNMPRLT